MFFFVKTRLSYETKNKYLFFHDWVHPTGAGNRVIAYKIFQFITNRLKLTPPISTNSPEANPDNYKQLEIDYLKSLFVVNQIEDISYATCVVIHGKCTHFETKVPIIEYLISVIESSLGALLQFNNELRTKPNILIFTESKLLKTIKTYPKVSIPYWLLAQVYRLKKQDQLALKFEQKSIQINPLLKEVSFDRLYNKFIKKHKPSPLISSFSNFINTLTQVPNYQSQYVHFWDLKNRSNLNKKQKMNLIIKLYAANPLLFRSLFEYAVNYLIKENELKEALHLTRTLGKFKPEQEFVFKKMEERIMTLMQQTK